MKKVIPIFIAIICLFTLWFLAAWVMQPAPGSRPTLPGPLLVFQELKVLFIEQAFHKDIVHSLIRIILGLLAAMIPAFILGIWFGLSKRVMDTAKPLFSFAKTLPPVALIPILIIWLGIGLTQQVALLFIGIFFNLTMMVAETVANLPDTFKNASKTLGINNKGFVWKIVMPYGMPEFINHIRIMMGVAWTYLIVVEMVAARSGIGRVIIDSQKFFLTGRVLAGVFTVGVLGVLIDLVLQLTSHCFCRWKHEDNYWIGLKTIIRHPIATIKQTFSPERLPD